MVVQVLAGIVYISHVCKCTFVGMMEMESRHTWMSKTVCPVTNSRNPLMAVRFLALWLTIHKKNVSHLSSFKLIG